MTSKGSEVQTLAEQEKVQRVKAKLRQKYAELEEKKAERRTIVLEPDQAPAPAIRKKRRHKTQTLTRNTGETMCVVTATHAVKPAPPKNKENSKSTARERLAQRLKAQKRGVRR
jgi:hypothetical protein